MLSEVVFDQDAALFKYEIAPATAALVIIAASMHDAASLLLTFIPPDALNAIPCGIANPFYLADPDMRLPAFFDPTRQIPNMIRDLN